jgi:glutaredoxin-related protein
MSNWPTFPQVYVHGALIGGLDILTEMSVRLCGLPQTSSSNTFGFDYIHHLYIYIY